MKITSYKNKSQAELISEIERLQTELDAKTKRIEELEQAKSKAVSHEQELSALIQGAKSVLEHQNFTEAARAIFDHCKKAIGADSGYVAMLSDDGEENELLFLEAGGRPCSVDPELPMPIRGLRAEAYATNQPVYHNDFMHSEWIQFMPNGHVVLNNVLFAPLILKGQTVGVLGIANKDGDFDDRDAHIASAFAELAAIALQNSRNLDELIESRERLKTFSDASFEALFFSEKGVCVDQNPAAEEMFGYTREEAVGTHGDQWIVPEERERVRQKMMQKTTLPYEVTALRKDGSTFPAEIQARTVSYAGRIVRVTALRDISVLKQARDEFIQSEERLRQVVENMPVMMDAMDENFHIVVWNHECERVTGYSAQEIMAAAEPLELLYPDREYRDQLFDQNAPMRFDFRDQESEITCKDGSLKTISWSNISDRFPIPGWFTWAVGVDVTDRKKAEKALVQAKAEAEKASKAKSEFLANMSHEIRTPINAMLGFSEVLMDQRIGPLNPKQIKYLDHVIESTNRLMHLINDILDLSKIEAGKFKIRPETFAFDPFIKRIQQTLMSLAGKKRLSTQLRVAPGIPDYLIGDDHRIEQVLRNLISNAVKFTPKGSIIVSVKKTADDALRFSVQDTGVGVPHEYQEALFTKFYQVDSSYAKKQAGAGLGLAISKELVEMMAGEIGFDSQEGVGSDFFFTLPLKTPGPGDSVREEPSEKPTPTRSTQRVLKILLAEDDELNRRSMSYFLKRQGHEITYAVNGHEVLAFMARYAFDIILMDVQMPKMDGVEATRRIREAQDAEFDTQTPIIALTAYVMKGDREKFLKAGMDDYVSKPIDYDMLFEKMDALIQRKRS